jgi:hypothetical protein
VAGDERRSTFSAAVLFVGAAAGLTILVSLIGTLVSWARFYALDLPSHAASATPAQSTLLLRGANALAGPIVAGLAAAGISLLLRWLVSTPRRRGVAAAGSVFVLLLAVSAGPSLPPGASLSTSPSPAYSSRQASRLGFRSFVRRLPPT